VVFQLQQLSKYGSSTPAIARTFFQGSKLLDPFRLSDSIKDQVRQALFDFQLRVIRCVEICDDVRFKVEDGKDPAKGGGLQMQSGHVAKLPSVPDVETLAESYLQAAKLSVAYAIRIINPFFSTDFDHRLHQVVNWAKETFGEEDPLYEVTAAWQPFVKRVVDMRNAVDHPMDKPGGRLHISNFRLQFVDSNPILVEPSWNLTGENALPIVTEMQRANDALILLGEDLLVTSLLKSEPNSPLYIYEIPESERDAALPLRLRVGFDPSRVNKT